MSQKRRFEDRVRDRAPRPKKKFRKQTDYHSSSGSEDEEGGFAPVNLNDSSDDEVKSKSKQSRHATGANATTKSPATVEDESEDEIRSEDDEEDEEGEQGEGDGIRPKPKKTSKRNDPEAFSTSISKILSTKLSQSARQDPVLSRSKEAHETSASLANERLERKARAKLRADKKEDLDRGRVKDVLGLTTGDAGEIAEEEKKLRKIAQRGVIKLFNAVRAAQVKGEEVARQERLKGTVGVKNRQEKINEMSKQGFLDLINGKQSKAIQEA